MLRRETEVKALRLRHSLNLGTDTPVNIFDTIRRLRLWLVFQPLSQVFGTYQRQNQTAGIAVNVKVHPAMQRFTAAHELGHHIMEHSAAIDPESNVTRFSGLADQELAAQMFAAEFLMPLAAVNAAAKRLGLQTPDVDAADVYQISLRLGVSYAATVVRLETLGLIDRQRSSQLRRTSPQPVKRSLLGDTELEDWRSDVWVVNPDGSDCDVHPLVGDRIVLNLPEIPSSGYRWYAESPTGCVVAEDELRLPSDDPAYVGVTGDRHLNIRVDEPGLGALSLRLHQPWDGGDVSRQIGVDVSASERPQPGLYGPQRTAVLAS